MWCFNNELPRNWKPLTTAPPGRFQQPYFHISTFRTNLQFHSKLCGAAPSHSHGAVRRGVDSPSKNTSSTADLSEEFPGTRAACEIMPSDRSLTKRVLPGHFEFKLFSEWRDSRPITHGSNGRAKKRRSIRSQSYRGPSPIRLSLIHRPILSGDYFRGYPRELPESKLRRVSNTSKPQKRGTGQSFRGAPREGSQTNCI